MKTLNEVLEMQSRINASVLNAYIARGWIRPRKEQDIWCFEEIDIARLELICHLAQDIEVNDEGLDIVLSLLDQLYGLRTHMKYIAHAINLQHPQVRTEVISLVNQLKNNQP